MSQKEAEDEQRGDIGMEWESFELKEKTTGQETTRGWSSHSEIDGQSRRDSDILRYWIDGWSRRDLN